MNIRLLSGYEYDLNSETEFKNLQANIRTMSARVQNERLAHVFDQVEIFWDYTGKKKGKQRSKLIYDQLTPLMEIDTDYLFLPNLSTDNKEYIISMPPMNSSGDIYHILSYLMLAEIHHKRVPKVQLTYDSKDEEQNTEAKMNTYTQVKRSLRFAKMLDCKQYFLKPIKLETRKCQRENHRVKVLMEYFAGLTKHVHYIDQKALTTLIAYHFIRFGRKSTTDRLRTRYSQLDTDYCPKKIKKEIKNKVAQECKQ